MTASGCPPSDTEQRGEQGGHLWLCVCVNARLCYPCVSVCVCVYGWCPCWMNSILMSCSVTVWVYSCRETLKSFSLHTKAGCPSHFLEHNDWGGGERARESAGFGNQNMMSKQTPAASNFVPVWSNLCRFLQLRGLWRCPVEGLFSPRALSLSVQHVREIFFQPWVLKAHARFQCCCM